MMMLMLAAVGGLRSIQWGSIDTAAAPVDELLIGAAWLDIRFIVVGIALDLTITSFSCTDMSWSRKELMAVWR